MSDRVRLLLEHLAALKQEVATYRLRLHAEEGLARFDADIARLVAEALPP